MPTRKGQPASCERVRQEGSGTALNPRWGFLKLPKAPGRARGGVGGLLPQSQTLSVYTEQRETESGPRRLAFLGCRRNPSELVYRPLGTHGSDNGEERAPPRNPEGRALLETSSPLHMPPARQDGGGGRGWGAKHPYFCPGRNQTDANLQLHARAKTP